MFDNLLEKVNEQLGEEDYKSKVDVRVYIKDLEAGEEVNVVGSEQELTYSINIEYRSWGIKDISVMPRGVVEFEVQIFDVDDNVIKTLPVKIDFDTVDSSIEWTKGGSYCPTELEVHLTRDGKVEDVILMFDYLDMS